MREFLACWRNTSCGAQRAAFCASLGDQQDLDLIQTVSYDAPASAGCLLNFAEQINKALAEWLLVADWD
jgi:hypothetical protein